MDQKTNQILYLLTYKLMNYQIFLNNIALGDMFLEIIYHLLIIYIMLNLIFPQQLKHIKNMVRSVASETYTTVSAPIQYAAIKAFSEDHSQYLVNSRKILEIIANYIHQELTDVGVKCQKPQGGFYMICDFSDVVKQTNEIVDGKSLCNKILNEIGFAMLPGSDFGIENKFFILVNLFCFHLTLII